MFTTDQINAIHAQVKSGADFPKYVKDLKAIGVVSYNIYVCDGHSRYFGDNGYTTTGEGKYIAMHIAEKSNKAEFERILKEHQNGLSDYLTFCRQAAENGIEKWTVHMIEMTCTYYNRHGAEIVKEIIPEAITA